MKAAIRTMPRFEPHRVLLVAAILALPASVLGISMGGWGAGASLALGTLLSCLAFAFLDRSLRNVGPETHTLGLFLESTGRVGLLAVAGIVSAAMWGVAGGAGFLTGILIVKISVVIEGVRSGGG